MSATWNARWRISGLGKQAIPRGELASDSGLVGHMRGGEAPDVDGELVWRSTARGVLRAHCVYSVVSVPRLDRRTAMAWIILQRDGSAVGRGNRTRIGALLLAGLLWPPASADEADGLLARAKPPARFQGHKPSFRAQEADFSWQDHEKSPGQAQPEFAPRIEKKLAIFDGDRLIGYMHTFRGAWREIHMFAWKPNSELLAQVKPDDWDREYMRDWGDCLPLIVAGYHEDAAADEQVTRVEGGGESLTFIRNFTWKPTGREKGLDQEALQTTPSASTRSSATSSSKRSDGRRTGSRRTPRPSSRSPACPWASSLGSAR